MKRAARFRKSSRSSICADRVETTSTVWLGLTINCCRCHDHKFDPFTQRDYYSLLAFYHNLPEVGLGNAGANIGRTAPRLSISRRPSWKQKSPTSNASWRTSSANSGGRRNPKRPTRRNLPSGFKSSSDRSIEAEQEIPTALVMQEMPRPRPTYILVRGAYNKHGAQVTAGTPATLPPLASGLPRNRLGLARWLVDPANPLPARVTVNRLWQSLFGVGLVRTTEDFGTQGELPSHPELLDWLATEFHRRDWNVKADAAAFGHELDISPKLADHSRAPGPRSGKSAAGARSPFSPAGGVFA